jgi:FKBP-type peptidyl-prolyl cis-trans isomerase FkpA
MRQILTSIICLLFFAACETASTTSFELADSGLHYHFHKQLDGTKPQVGDEIQYHITVRKGDKLLSETDKKQLMPLSPNNNPILQAFQLMGLGDSLTLALFVDSLPKRMTEKFESGDTMLVDLKITDIRRKVDIDKKVADMNARADNVTQNVRGHIKNFKNGNLTCQKTSSGLQYVIEKEGTGKIAADANRVSLHYAGFLTNGSEFESTFRKGKPKAFYFDDRTQTVPGFTEGLQLLKAGSKATLIIPHNLAYGDKGLGPIPPASDLVIYVEMLEVH